MSSSCTNSKRKLVLYMTAGYPDRTRCLRYMKTAAESGADAIELGIPFSDPLADGPVIQKATHAALRRGMTAADTLKLATAFSRWRRGRNVRLYLMTYLNPILAYGLGRFMTDARDAGVETVIPVDLIPEEAEEVQRAASTGGLKIAFLSSVTCSPGRLRRIARASTGFIYLVSLKGVTGSPAGPLDDVAPIIGQLRRVTSTPVYLGFGISTPRQARTYARLADGIVVGTALLRKIGAPGDRSAAVRRFVASLRKAVDQADRSDPRPD